MLVTPPLPANGYRHNYVRLVFVLGTLLLFIGYIAVNQLYERGNSCRFIRIFLFFKQVDEEIF